MLNSETSLAEQLVPPEIQAARKRVFDIRGELESNLEAIESYAKMLNTIATSEDIEERYAAALAQIGSDISARVVGIWDGDLADLMKMLPSELHTYWGFSAGVESEGDAS